MKIIDMHCDTLSAPASSETSGRILRFRSEHHSDFTGWMQQSNLSGSEFCSIHQSGRDSDSSSGRIGNDRSVLFRNGRTSRYHSSGPLLSDIEKNQSDGVMSAAVNRRGRTDYPWKTGIFAHSVSAWHAHDDTYLESRKFPWISKSNGKKA